MQAPDLNSTEKSRSIDTGMAATLICLLLHVFAPKIPFTLAAAISFLVLTMSAPLVLAPLSKVWFAFSATLGRIMTPALLSVVFLAVVTPIGLLVRRKRKEAHKLSEFKSGNQSVFHHRDYKFSDSDLRHPY